MAGSKVNEYGIADVNLSALMTSTDAQRIGFHSLTLTEFDTDVKPAIAAGSKVEVNGSLFKFDTEEAITGTPSDGDVYILLVPSGNSITAQFTNTAPTWSDSKQGWYGTGGQANYRYANFIMTKDTADYSDKRYLLHDPETKVDNLTVKSFDLTTFVTQDLSESGYVKIGPLYIQWGNQIINAANTTITLPKEYPNTHLSIALSGGYDNTDYRPYKCYDLTTTNFKISSGGSGSSTVPIYWISIGY